VAEFDAAKDAANTRTHAPGLARFADMTGRFVAADLRIPEHREHSFRFNVNADSGHREHGFRPS